jgi:hypothetical protein
VKLLHGWLLAGLLWAVLPVAIAVAQAPASPPVSPLVSPPASSGQAPAQDVWLPQPLAELQALDKITARVSPLTIRVGQSGSFGSLSIFVRACVIRAADRPADTAMFLDIIDSHPGAPAFHGWMIVSVPGAAMLEHPVYDIRPAACHA